MWNDILSLMKQELVLCVIIFMLLFIRVGVPDWRNEGLLQLVNGLLAANLVAGVFMSGEGVLFGGMFHTSRLIVLEKNILNLGTLIISLQAYGWLKRNDHVLEFYILLLATLLGLFFMISAGHLLTFYLGLELSAIPLAALCNFDLTQKRSSEAAMKFIMSSAFASGLLLFGISLIYGMTGSLDLTRIGEVIGQAMGPGAVGPGVGQAGMALLSFAFILLLSGFAFKISVVPFHLWTADVYEGAPVMVTAYLSVISKGSIFFVLVPVLYTVFKPVSVEWGRILFLLAILTMLTGNLFAMRQNNMKRLLAFSSIAQVGFILVGITGNDRAGAASVVYFILIYLFSNLGAFGVIALISAATGRESISDYRGLYKTNPFLSWVLAISLFSLAGIPPTAGFFGKFFLLLAGAGKGNYLLILIAALNMILSLYYYLRVIKAIFMEDQELPLEKQAVPVLPGLGMGLCLVGIIGTGFVGWIYDYIFSLNYGY